MPPAVIPALRRSRIVDPPGSADAVLETYLCAKDANRPRLAERAFDPAATLEVVDRSSVMAFPAETRGAAAIVDVLVRQFARLYEDVHTLCLARPAPDATAFSCDWLVGMTAKDGCALRVGAGRYDWTLDPRPWRAMRLVITIEAMQVLPASGATAIDTWLGQFDPPWSTARAAVGLAPRDVRLAAVLDYLRRGPPEMTR